MTVQKDFTKIKISKPFAHNAHQTHQRKVPGQNQRMIVLIGTYVDIHIINTPPYIIYWTRLYLNSIYISFPKFSCRDSKNSTSLCDKNADCWFIKETNGHECRCKKGFQIDGLKIDPITKLENPKNPICLDNCIDRTTRSKVCKNQGICLKVQLPVDFIVSTYQCENYL